MTVSAPLALSRRAVLASSFGAAFLGSRAFAAATANRKLVVIIARGGMDGCSLIPPIGDPNYAALRGPIAIPAEAVLRLDETFGLHPKLENLYRMNRAGQARIAPAVAIPERIRSHFEAQDLLESGGAKLYGATTGWLNRALAAGGGQPLKALSVGAQTPLILRGPTQAQSWSPGGAAPPSSDRLVAALQDLYAGDRLLGPALASGLQTESMADMLSDGKAPNAGDPQAFAVTAARFLAAPNGPQMAVLSLDGFDTHARQGAAEGQLANRLRILDQVLAGLETGLGPAWKDTVVVVATEFGRTARINGTLGLDHGTASALVLAGGALKPGGIVGDWPTLADDKLFENRDLAPTLDVRSVFKGVLIDHMGLDRRAVETAVFPNGAAAAPVQGLV
ncbi:MAG TPA: DUF1501 domain-containing protein [Caulobacteraceae bacterium]|jgi:uncharacterized protein (DUF1501 family)|nr:DUF1501 domain-containing protein [Caulobacteraceae bacterium]